MKIKKVRVQNFRSVADSGELALDEHVTILVGTNECGKTAIMDALRYFNRGENFDDADVSTLTIHDQLFTPGFDRSSIPMVTVWAVLEPDDSTRLALPQAAQEHQIKIIKKLDNDYDVETPWLTAQPPIPSDATTPNPLQTILERIHAVLSNVYEGYVKDKQPNFSHVWLARSEHEDKSDNLVLFPEWAEKIWDDLEQGDWLQVTRIAEDPYGRNPRALNAAFRVDITPLKKTLADIIESVASSGYIDTNLRDLFIGQIHDISPQHPIREYFAPDLLESIADLPSSQPAAIAAADFESWVRDNQPRFIYLAETTEVSDELPIPEYVPHVPGALRRDNLVDALARAAGLNPHVFHPQVAPMSRLAILEAKSQAITERFKYLWQDLNLGFHELGEKLALGVQARGNFAPPSRRSAGLRSFLSLFTELLAFTDRRNVVLLLDDPGVHLHPKKQEEMAKFLGNQACQVVIATHLPHTIDPEGLDKVRAIVRTDDAGSRVAINWLEDKDALEAVYGRLTTQFAKSSILLVEGKKDWLAYERLSNSCRSAGLDCLPDGVPLVSAGGDNMVWMAGSLMRAGMRPIVLLDGDHAGQKNQKKLKKDAGVEAHMVVSLHDVFGQGWKLEDLLSPGEETKAKDQRRERAHEFAEETLRRFASVFQRITEIHAGMSASAGP